MRGFLSILFILVIVLMVYPFVLVDDDAADRLTGLPWQVDRLDDGQTRVFGLAPGESTLADAVAALGDDHELGLIERDGALSLEMYFGRYRAGLMSAKIVLLTQVPQAQLGSWKQRAVDVQSMQTGKAKRYRLNPDDAQQALRSVVRLISFIPAVNLDDEVIRARFGDPAQVVQQEGLTHYRYPMLGLQISVREEAREVLQYVAPERFADLINPP